jgi:CheY-like chemotaxis protein
MRVLIAEDDVALARFVSQGLEVEHYTVDVYSDGEQACTAAHEVDYNLIILDRNLPKLDGVSVLRQLRLKKPTLPVLVLTERSRVVPRIFFPLARQPVRSSLTSHPRHSTHLPAKSKEASRCLIFPFHCQGLLPNPRPCRPSPTI